MEEFFSVQTKFKTEHSTLFAPCELLIKDGVMAFRKRSVAGIAIGGIVGHVLSKKAREKNEVIIIPIKEITSVETKSSAVTACVIVTSQNRPIYTFACFSQDEMHQLYACLQK